MLDVVRRWLTSDSAKRVGRTFLITFAAILIPGLLGWLHGLTTWARSQGQAPFPDGHTLAYLAVSAIGAAVVAVVNLIWVLIEDATGKAVLRAAALPPVPARKTTKKRTETGAGEFYSLCVVATLVLVILLASGVLPPHH